MERLPEPTRDYSQFIYLFIYTLFTKADNRQLNNRTNIVQLFYIAMQMRICAC